MATKRKRQQDPQDPAAAQEEPGKPGPMYMTPDEVVLVLLRWPEMIRYLTVCERAQKKADRLRGDCVDVLRAHTDFYRTWRAFLWPR